MIQDPELLQLHCHLWNLLVRQVVTQINLIPALLTHYIHFLNELSDELILPPLKKVFCDADNDASICHVHFICLL